eukprot:CAMPEP_0185706872 /NCGR_PEP_ID=MMETSP1164-20130828/22745_1 /TAXON_ID=1104430 /ORGANISM="Chrysoreinhardia sp, Strain CCMP2950" /LENGTH=266 /DNA_ID=CAMNT_0028374285 /DNA_START=53 /DNA_END=849 /DNA_ORIENTATION=+
MRAFQVLVLAVLAALGLALVAKQQAPVVVQTVVHDDDDLAFAPVAEAFEVYDAALDNAAVASDEAISARRKAASVLAEPGTPTAPSAASKQATGGTPGRPEGGSAHDRAASDAHCSPRAWAGPARDTSRSAASPASSISSPSELTPHLFKNRRASSHYLFLLLLRVSQIAATPSPLRRDTCTLSSPLQHPPSARELGGSPPRACTSRSSPVAVSSLHLHHKTRNTWSAVVVVSREPTELPNPKITSLGRSAHNKHHTPYVTLRASR